MNSDELDSLRNRASAEPLVRGGTSMVTHRLDCSDPERWEFKKTGCYQSVMVVMLIIGTVIAGCGIFTGSGDLGSRIFPLVFGGIFLLIALFLFFNGRHLAKFDFAQGYYWKDRRNPGCNGVEGLRDDLPLKEIAALQVVDELCHGSKGATWYSYELNLVRKNGLRLNVVDHGGRKAVVEDARKLAERLNVPVWGLHEEDESGARPPVRKITWALILFGIVFAGAGAAMLWFLSISPVVLHFASETWEKVPATVVSSELERSRGSKGGTTYRIAVSYDYEYQGTNYCSDRYDITRSGSSSNIGVDGMREAVRRHPVGARVICRVNPDDPQQALIDRELPASFFLFMVWFPLPFLGFGIYALAFGIRGR